MQFRWMLAALSMAFAFNTSPASAAFVQCSAPQQGVINQAVSNAYLWLGRAIDDFSRPLPNPTYSKWFGSWTQARGDRVRRNLANLRSHMTVANTTFHCGCPAGLEQRGVIAAVHSPADGITEQPYHIHLCTAFFSLGDNGADSKAGTLIHEMSHFDVVNSTRDFCYGASECSEKAVTNPDEVIRAADSYQYYVESFQ